jgi:hypothetical protein
MPRRKLNLEQIRASLNVACPHCGMSIQRKAAVKYDAQRGECVFDSLCHS